jgi:hypothetical protein
MNQHLHNFRFGPRAGLNSALVMVFLAVFVALGLNTGLRNSSGETVDEVRGITSKGVLGASSKSDLNPCPDAKPVIGWIDLDGKKMIVYTLAKDQKASVCFETEALANAAGYSKN